MTRFYLIAFLMLFALSINESSASKAEFRGIWVHNWRTGLLNKAEVDATIKWAVDTNMNAVIVQVRKVGDAYYDSAYEPRAANIKSDISFDPLAYSIAQAKAKGLEIHAWINVFRIATSDIHLIPGHIAVQHPEWLSKDSDGNTSSSDGMFLDPGIPEVRSYIVSLIADILTKYDVDGINLDYIRYPGKKWGYNNIAVKLFNAEYGREGIPSPDDAQWCNWRRKQVTETVRAIRAEMKRLKPNVTLSAATIAWGACPTEFTKTSAYAHLFQDWRSWMKDGLLDANMPMIYQDPAVSKSNTNFVSWLNGSKRWSYGRHTYSGLMVFKSNAKGIEKQIIQSRNKKMDGFVGFAFSQDNAASAISKQLKSGVLLKSTAVPPMSWKNTSVKDSGLK